MKKPAAADAAVGFTAKDIRDVTDISDAVRIPAEVQEKPMRKVYNLFFRRQAASRDKHFGGDGAVE